MHYQFNENDSSTVKKEKYDLRLKDLSSIAKTQDIVIIPKEQSVLKPEVYFYHGPIRMNQQDAQNKILRREQLNLKKKIEGAANIN